MNMQLLHIHLLEYVPVTIRDISVATLQTDGLFPDY
jgi:hypothetical protein